VSQRNNEDRLGAKTPMPDSTIPLEAGDSPSFDFNFTTPTEFVELPSKGRFYPEGHPLHNQEHIEIRYMTAKDEDILTSKALLRKGVAIDRFLQNIIVDKRIKVDDLLIGDKNALVVGSRVTGYGADYVTNIKCSSCDAAFEHSFNLESPTINSGSLPEGCSATENGTFFITLPKMKIRVEVRMLTGQDEKALAFIQEKRRKHKLPETNLTDQFRQFIVSVEGHKDPSIISKLIEHMPAVDSQHLRATYKEIVPNIDLKEEVTCEVCGREQEIDVPFTADFFWPK